MKKSLLPITSFGILMSSLAFGQYAPPDCGAVEAILVEKYYIADANDATDEDGGSLPEGAVTYRVYVDMKSDYVLESVFGSMDNPLSITTTTEFFNNEDRGEETGDAIDSGRLGDNTVALDSYLTLNAAGDEHLAVLKSEDPDGNIVAGEENDGGSEGIDGGLLVNDNPEIGIPLTDSDGLIVGTITSAATGEGSAVTIIGLDASPLGDENSSEDLIVSNGSWAVLGGVVGPTEENRVLIAQITTDGEFEFEINFRVGIPEELQCNTSNCHEDMDFVAVMTEDQMVSSIQNDRICSLNGLTVILSSEEEEFAKQSFSIYPNPAEETVTVALNPKWTGEFNYRIYDISGRLVKSGNPNQFGEGLMSFNVSDLLSGTYLIEIENDGVTSTERFVKK